MERSYWRTAIILVVALGAFWLLVPSVYSFFVLPREQRNDVKALQARLPKVVSAPARYRLSLGLDLQGGIHMVMRVDTRTALQKRTERRGVEIANYLKEKNLDVTPESDPERLELTLVAKDASTMDAIEKEVLGTFKDFVKISRAGGKLVLAPRESELDRFRTQAVDQAMLVIRQRIDKWGVAEVDVRKLGTDAIQISLPGRQDPEQAKELVGTTAQLEFRMVDDQSTLFRDLLSKDPPPQASGIALTTAEGFPQLESKDREALLAYVKGKAPQDREVLLECVESATTKKGQCDSYRTYLVERHAPLTGDNLSGADASYGQFGDPEVNMSFDANGARAFSELTEKNTGKRMAIVLDDVVRSAPRINEKIPNGRARITLGGAGAKSNDERLQEANTLALVLKAGALPAPVSIAEIRQVGASLGDELIKKGAYAAGMGLLLVLIFMGFYYRRSGLIADVALALNGVLILAGLALFNATLTLPGIAGFVLTLGIAVDANVLINERVREELGHGKTPRAAVDAGYDRAFWTIFDAHVTTLIAGFILFFVGTGPVRGFATALIIGIIASLFTSIVVTRAIISPLVRNAQRISI